MPSFDSYDRNMNACRSLRLWDLITYCISEQDSSIVFTCPFQEKRYITKIHWSGAAWNKPFSDLNL